MIDGENFFDRPVKKNLRTYNNIPKIATGQRNDYTTSWLLDYNYFIKYYKMIARDLSKRQALHTDPKVMQQISFTGIFNRCGNVNGNTTMFFIIEKA